MTQVQKSESIKELALALVGFQSEVAKIKKDANNPFFKSSYATLSQILDVIREPLAKHDLSFVQFPTGEHELCTVLMHTSGEWISGSYSMEPAKKDPQGLGSVITYQRRYALAAILGLNIDDDDDANAASQTNKQANKPQQQTQMAPGAELPWMREKDFEAVKKRIVGGDFDAFENAKKHFRIKVAYRDELKKTISERQKQTA